MIQNIAFSEDMDLAHEAHLAPSDIQCGGTVWHAVKISEVKVFSISMGPPI